MRTLIAAQGFARGSAQALRELSEAPPAERAAGLGYLATVHSERDDPSGASARFAEASAIDPRWGAFGRAWIAVRSGKPGEAASSLDECLAEGAGATLRGLAWHLRGVAALQDNRHEEAIAALLHAREALGDWEFMSGRVFDALGMVYAARDDATSALALFEAAKSMKERTGDELGLAVTCGNLGRLHFRWGQLGEAEACFREDLRLCGVLGDRRGAIVMSNWLAKVELARGAWSAAAQLLEQCAEEARAQGAMAALGFALQDLAFALLKLGRIDEASGRTEEAGTIFAQSNHADGAAHVARVRGLIAAARGQFDAARERLRTAFEHFAGAAQWPEAAQTRLDLARVMRAEGAPQEQVLAELSQATELAERSRRDALALAIEGELREVSELEFHRRRYLRLRGRPAEDDDLSLNTGVREVVSVLYLDFKGSTEYALKTAPDVVMREFNQLMAAFSGVLERQRPILCGYRGDGFLAVYRGADHATRAVGSALELFSAMGSFNLARDLVGKKPYQVRIGINSGEAFCGNVGTYARTDFTALGTTMNLGARIEPAAEVGVPCIGAATQALVGEAFECRGPRVISAKGFSEPIEVWDVIARRG
ncbi:MAG: tetratricopeptide repeat protein [Deltaproteobacteria bacterium]|nr:tetratricopeptide repeat protein [Deltaproteobacteria bacterium]